MKLHFCEAIGRKCWGSFKEVASKYNGSVKKVLKKCLESAIEESRKLKCLENVMEVLWKCLRIVKEVSSKCWKVARKCGEIGTSGRRCSQSPLGGQLATSLVDRYFHHYFFFPFSVATFSHRRSAQIKKLILQKLMGAPRNLGVHHFPDPVGYFGAPWRLFWIFEAFIEGMIESKNLFSESWSEGPIT